MNKESEEQTAQAVYTRIARLKPVDGDGMRGLVEPMGHFSGDFIYTAKIPDGGTYILFADFSGHGLPAALGAIPVSSVFYSMSAKGYLPSEILKKINADLVTQLSTSQFCCACFISLNPQKTKISVWNSGIPDVLIVKDNGESVDRIPSINLPLGIQIDDDEMNNFKTIRLLKGDLLFFHTHGLTEAWGETRIAFGKERLEELIVNNYRDQNLLEIVMKEVIEHCGSDKKQEDDISMLEIRC